MKAGTAALVLALASLTLYASTVSDVVLVSQFAEGQVTVQPCRSLTASTMVLGGSQWQAGRYQFVVVFVGANGRYTQISPPSEAQLEAGSGVTIRVPSRPRRDIPVGFLVFYQWLDNPHAPYRSIWWPSKPVNGRNQVFSFSPGDRKLNGQLINPYNYYPETFDWKGPPHWNYTSPITGQRFYQTGALDPNGVVVGDPEMAPQVTVHDKLPVGDLWYALSYVLPDGRETATTAPQRVTVPRDRRSLMLHRNEELQQGVKWQYVYLGTNPYELHRQPCYVTGTNFWPRNWCSLLVSSMRLTNIPPRPAATTVWTASPLHMALLSNARTIVLDRNIETNCGPVIPYRPDVPMRRIVGDAWQEVKVLGPGELITNSSQYTYVENFRLVGEQATEGINYCDPNGGAAMQTRWTRMNIRPKQGYVLYADDPGGKCAITPNGVAVYDHTASEQHFHDCYFKGPLYIRGNQTVSFSFTQLRQDVNAGADPFWLETAGAHLMSNKFFQFSWWGVDETPRTILNLHNEAGPLTVDCDHLYADKANPLFISKGQNTPARVNLRSGTVNRQTGNQVFAVAPGGTLKLFLEGFNHQSPAAYGDVTVWSADEAERQGVRVQRP